MFSQVSHGSGKSTLAFDTLYAEGQRRYVESLSTYARQFLGQMNKPDVDLLEGLSPAVSIEQKTTSRNPRSTVGTVTEIYGSPAPALCPRWPAPLPGMRPAHSLPVDSRYDRDDSRSPRGRENDPAGPPGPHRKRGSHEQVFQRLRKEGFVRVRVDGEVRQLSEEISLEKNKHHFIEAVVDRLVIKPSIRRRLDESVSTAVALGGGTMLAHFPDSGEEVLFSESAACHQCGISLPELSTQLFSFNNPQGACPVCSGLGINQFIDEELIVPDDSLSLLEGAIVPWTRRRLSTQADNWIEAFARHYRFDPATPFADLPAKVKKGLLHGTGKTKLEFIHTRGKRSLVSNLAFEGVVPRLNRLFRETSSSRMREEIEGFMTEQGCPACHGARLKPEALAVRVGQWSIIDLCRMAIEQLISEMETISFEKRQGIIAAPILKENRERLFFLHGVGLGYLSLDRRAGTLSGGEAQRIRTGLTNRFGPGGCSLYSR